MKVQDVKLEVVEGCDAYYLYATYQQPDLLDESQEVACMGDGVDRVTPDLDECEWSASGSDIGTPEFLAGWQRDVDENFLEYLEAYFPELYDRLED